MAKLEREKTKKERKKFQKKVVTTDRKLRHPEPKISNDE